MRRSIVLIVMLVFFAAAPIKIFADDELTAEEIFNQYKNAAVAIEVILKFDNGQSAGMYGSGFFIDKDGYLITNAHVARYNLPIYVSPFSLKVFNVVGYEYWIVLPAKGRKYRAEVVGWDYNKDIAQMKVLNIDPADYDAVKIGNSDDVKIGDKVYAIGSPYGLKNTITSGIISSLHRHSDSKPTFLFIEDFIQTDAPINPGNSGGPLINECGEVIGINSAGYDADGLGFTIPINLLDRATLYNNQVELVYIGFDLLLNNFERSGTKIRPGFNDVKTLNELTGIEDLDSLITLARVTYDQHWAVVEDLDIDPKSPSAQAGFKRGDLIISFNGYEVKSGYDVRLLLYKLEAGKEFEVKIWRMMGGGLYRTLILRATPRERYSSKAQKLF
ncbi:MAG: trypsin-like peptidase domain-containing protein [bacterium]|nr:trypsin-like peptidase domain-containing protein [bacterium]